MDTVDEILSYEAGELGMEDTIILFQKLINTGLVWKLQGHYGRTARALIDTGECSA